MFRRTRVYLALAAIVLFGQSCSPDFSGPLEGTPVELQSAQLLLSAGDLTSQLNAERARIAIALRASTRDRDSLKVIWDRFRKDNKGVKRDGSPFPICEPVGYAAETRIIGPAGGTIKMGKHQLVIPAGALAQNTVITGEMPVSLLISARLYPHGLQFLKPVKLELSYDKCYLPADYQYRIAYITELNQVIAYPLSSDKKLKKAVVALLGHFSKYAIAY